MMVGGSDGEDIIDKTESTLDGESFTTHEPLPQRAVSGCLAFLDEDNFIYSGGYDPTFDDNATATPKAYMFNLTSGAVVRLNILSTSYGSLWDWISFNTNHLDYPTCPLVLSGKGAGWSSGGTAIPRNSWS